MKRIRIGKDISMRWEITTGGVAIPLEGRDLTVEIKSPMGIVSNIPYGVSGNTLIITYYGTEQKRVGEYSVTLWENKGKPGQNVVDVIRAFELVRTSQEEDDFVGGDLQIESVDLGTENFDILTEGGYRGINIDTLQAEALEDSVNIKGKTYSNESFTITLPKANLDSAGVIGASDVRTLKEHGDSIAQINTTLEEHTESINANITTDRIQDGAVTSEKIATSAFDSTLSVSGKIAPADVVGGKLTELDKEINGQKVSVTRETNGYTNRSRFSFVAGVPFSISVKGTGGITAIRLYDSETGEMKEIQSLSINSNQKKTVIPTVDGRYFDLYVVGGTLAEIEDTKGIIDDIKGIKDNVSEIETNISNINKKTTMFENDIYQLKYEEVDVTNELNALTESSTGSIQEDGSVHLSGGDMKVYKYVGDAVSFTINARIYINAGNSSRPYAFYSSTEPSAETYISGGEVINGAFVKQTEYKDVSIPSNAKCILFVSRTGGVTSLVRKSIRENVTKIELKKSLEYVINKPSSRKILYVKADGSGDYNTVQEALNSIVDANIDNQYEIRLCNDETYATPEQLWKVSLPTSHSAIIPSEACAAIITKDYVNIVGLNQRRKVSVIMPDSLDGGILQYIQAMFLVGNVVVDNIDFEVKNARYAIHQESGGSKLSKDYNARTILKNSDVVHLGNSGINGEKWTSCYAQANGACPGLEVEYHNVTWSPAFYMHQNADFDNGNKYLFDCCRIKLPHNGKFEGESLRCYIGANGSGHKSEIKFVGCDMLNMNWNIGIMQSSKINSPVRDIRTMLPNISGYGNRPLRIPTVPITNNCIAFVTKENNHSVEVMNYGVRVQDIWGETIRLWKGTIDAPGVTIGSQYYGEVTGNYAFSLAHRLGNCKNGNKTLNLRLDGVLQTVTFAENFVTTDGSEYTTATVPVYSDAQIIEYINAQLNGIEVMVNNPLYQKLYPMNDTSEFGRNYQTTTLIQGMAVVRDYANPLGWKVCTNGKPEGIVCERINPGDGGFIALIDKNYFYYLYGLSYYKTIREEYTIGTMIKANVTGYFSETDNQDEACMVCIAPSTWKSL